MKTEEFNKEVEKFFWDTKYIMLFIFIVILFFKIF